jgi:imidazolonepropionase-like amidohydrolase
MSPEIVKEIIRRSHEQGIPVVMHIGRNEDVKTAIECGADGIAHNVYKEPMDSGLARELAAKKMFVTPTIYVFHELGLFVNEKNYTRYTQLEWETMHPSAKKALQNPKPYHTAKGEQWAAYYDRFKGPYKGILLQNLKVLKEAGVTIVAGTDSPNLGIASGGSLHVELAYFVEAGFTPEEALLSATSVPARVLREVFHKNVKFGTIENGRTADLLLVEGDPTKNIQDTRKIVKVFYQGKLLDRRKE